MMTADTRHTMARSLFPDLAAQADALTPRHTRATAAAERWLTAETERMRAGEFGRVLARYPDQASAAALTGSFAAARVLAAGLGITAPEPEDFLAAREATGRTASLEPSAQDTQPQLGTHCAPVIAPHGLGIAPWLRWFTDDAGEARRSPAGLHPTATGMPALALATEARRWFAALDAVAALEAPSVTVRERIGKVRWTLRWIPVAQDPPSRGVPFASADAASYPTLPEMLALVVARRGAGLPLLDPHAFTWLAGNLPSPAFAARHTYDPQTDTVRISTRERTDQGAHVGVRLALDCDA